MSPNPFDGVKHPAAAQPEEAPAPGPSVLDRALVFRRSQHRFAEALQERLEDVDTGLRRWAIQNVKDERPPAPKPAPRPAPAPKKSYAERLSARLKKK